MSIEHLKMSCVKCDKELTIGDLDGHIYCMNEDCYRYGLVTVANKMDFGDELSSQEKE